MLEDKKQLRTAHNVIIENRKNIIVSGIEDVESFNEDTIVLYTDMGTLSIKGEDLHINKLSVETGDVSIEGEIYSLDYTDDEQKRQTGGFFSKLFK